MSDRGYYVAKIRHEFTRYDKLAAFYAVYPHQRHRLNHAIACLIDDQITIDEFRATVRAIENSVDLTIKRNQKKYIRMESAKLRRRGHQDDYAKRIAKLNLQAHIKFQDEYNHGNHRDGFWEGFVLRGRKK